MLFFRMSLQKYAKQRNDRSPTATWAKPATVPDMMSCMALLPPFLSLIANHRWGRGRLKYAIAVLFSQAPRDVGLDYKAKGRLVLLWSLLVLLGVVHKQERGQKGLCKCTKHASRTRSQLLKYGKKKKLQYSKRTDYRYPVLQTRGPNREVISTTAVWYSLENSMELL